MSRQRKQRREEARQRQAQYQRARSGERSMSNGHLQLPGRLNVSFAMQQGPNADGVGFNLQQPGGIQVIQFGGFTKVEHAAIQFAAQMAGNYCPLPSTVDDPDNVKRLREDIALEAVRLARAVLTAANTPLPEDHHGEEESSGDQPGDGGPDAAQESDHPEDREPPRGNIIVPD